MIRKREGTRGLSWNRHVTRWWKCRGAQSIPCSWFNLQIGERIKLESEPGSDENARQNDVSFYLYI